MKLIRLNKLREFTDQWGAWVVCSDPHHKEWTLPKTVFEQFKYLGLPTIDESMEAEFHKLLGGRHYPEIPKANRHHLIKQLLEICTQEPIEFLFPNI